MSITKGFKALCQKHNIHQIEIEEYEDAWEARLWRFDKVFLVNGCHDIFVKLMEPTTKEKVLKALIDGINEGFEDCTDDDCELCHPKSQ